LVLAALVLAVLGFVFRPSGAHLPLADTAARMATDLSSLETSVAAGSPGAAVVRVRADLAEAHRVPPPTDPVDRSAWRYAVSEGTAALAEVGRDTPLAETDLAAALQAVLLVEPGQHS